MARLVADPDRGGDVVVAPATPPGVSALAVVRLTGPPGETLAVARRIAPRLPGRAAPARGGAALRLVGEDGRPLDRAARALLSGAALGHGRGGRGVLLPRVARGRRGAPRGGAARRGRGRRRGASSRGAPSRTASWISRRPRASPRSRGRRAAARRGGRSRSWRESCRGACRPRARERSTCFPGSRPRWTSPRTFSPRTCAPRPTPLEAVAAEADDARRGRRAGRRARPPQGGRDSRAAERGKVDALQRPRRARSRHRHGRARHDARRDLRDRARSAGESVTLLDTAGLRDARTRSSGSASPSRRGRGRRRTSSSTSSMRVVECPKRTKIFLEGEEGRGRSS